MFDAVRNLIDVRFTGTHAIHGLVHKASNRICAVSNFNISPKTVIEKSSAEFSDQFVAVYNMQKIINLNESLRPKIRARQGLPVSLIYQNDFIFEDNSVIPPEIVTLAEFATEKVAAVDFVARYINEMRRPYNSVALFLQQKIYASKEAESKLIMKQVRQYDRQAREEPPNEEKLKEVSPYVTDYAEMMGIPFLDAAELIENKSREENAALTHSEHERLRMYHEIGIAEDVDTLRNFVKEFIKRNDIHITGEPNHHHDHNH